MPSELDTIFFQVPLSQKAAPDRVTVYVDTKTRVAVEAATLNILDKARWAGRDKIRYDIWPDQSIILKKLQEQIPNFLTLEEMPVDYRMRVSVQRTDILKLARSLYQPNKPPETVLRQRVGQFLAQKLELQSRKSREAMAIHLSANAKKWEDELVVYIYDAFGLNVELILQPTKDLELETRVAFGPIDVKPQDAPREGGMSVTGDAVIVRSATVEAVEEPPLTEQGWAELVRRSVERTYRDRITMRDHLYQAESVRIELLNNLDERVKKFGREVKRDSFFIRTRTTGDKTPDSETRVASDHEWTSKRWGRKVLFRAEARMTLVRPANWPTGRDRDLDAWFKAAIGPAIENTMHGRDFDSLEVEDDDAFRSEVAKILTPKAEAVGYRLELLIFISQNEPRDGLKWFSVLIPPTINDAWVGYDTKRPGVRAKFQIEVRMRLSTLKGHAERFAGNRGLETLKDEVAATSSDSARRFMRLVAADDYVKNWEEWPAHFDKDEKRPKLALYGELQDHIKVDLKADFSPAEFEIGLFRDLSPMSDYKAKATRLRLRPIVVTPKIRDTDFDAQEADYTLRFSVADIDPDFVVEVMATGRDTLEREPIEQDIREASEAALRRLSSLELQDLNYEDVTRPGYSPLAQRVLEQVQRGIGEKYALRLRLDGVTRDRSRAERTERGELGAEIRLREARIFVLGDTIDGLPNEAKKRRAFALERVEALERALLAAETQTPPDSHLIEERRLLVSRAKQDLEDLNRQWRKAIIEAREDVSEASPQSPRLEAPRSGETSARRDDGPRRNREPDELDS
ncbi:hypothetical protein [Methylocapsa sp. S129]|uniref:hypothetical protein n=1 Tax=Methylocapsa sp. S129 TaxID=1641869 RepID=UPI00131AB06D|nr:hypothetical protein [Methylocapsa sp. S129]